MAEKELKIKKGSPEEKVKKKFIDDNPLFKIEKKFKKHLKEKLEKKNKKFNDFKEKDDAEQKRRKARIAAEKRDKEKGYMLTKDVKSIKDVAKGGKDFAKEIKTGVKNIKKQMRAGGMTDLSGDGKITKKDVLIGRGVIKKKAGGKIKAKKMNKCRMDGIAIRGKTRAKQRSK